VSEAQQSGSGNYKSVVLGSSELRENVQNESFKMGGDHILTNCERIRVSTSVSELEPIVLEVLLYVIADNGQALEHIEKIVLFHSG